MFVLVCICMHIHMGVHMHRSTGMYAHASACAQACTDICTSVCAWSLLQRSGWRVSVDMAAPGILLCRLEVATEHDNRLGKAGRRILHLPNQASRKPHIQLLPEQGLWLQAGQPMRCSWTPTSLTSATDVGW